MSFYVFFFWNGDLLIINEFCVYFKAVKELRMVSPQRVIEFQKQELQTAENFWNKTKWKLIHL